METVINSQIALDCSSFINTRLFTEPSEITMGCEQRILSPVCDTSECLFEGFSADLDDETDFDNFYTIGASIQGSGFQVWEKCLSSIANSFPEIKSCSTYAL